jgi:hypothetical protein
MIPKNKTPASAENGNRGETMQQVSKTYLNNNTLIENHSQHAVRWLTTHYHLSTTMALVIAENAGLGGGK